MLSDLERKTLRILFNFIRANGRAPTIQELRRKTGSKPHQIYQAIDRLAELRCIEWEDRQLHTIKIITSMDRLDW
jgi:DNA-binding MarR family transcriptional regulator